MTTSTNLQSEETNGMRIEPTTQREMQEASSSLLPCVFALCLILASCNNSPQSSPAEESASPVTASLTTKKASSSTVTEPSSSTMPEPTQEEVITEIEAFMQNVRIIWQTCSAKPQDCNAEQDLGKVFGGPALVSVLDQLGQRTANSIEVKPPIDDKHDQYTVENIEIRSATADVANVTYCIVDGFIVVKPNAAPDGSDLIVDDQVYVVRRQAELSRTSLGWRLTTEKDLETFSNEDGCEQ